jgi:predicted nucleic-acid-binding Zn-ribbon protein
MVPYPMVMRVHPYPEQRGLVGTRGRGDLMAFVRKCEKCGNVDDREQWSSASEAADQGAFQNWTCPSCAWTEFELIDSDAEAAKTTS